MTCPRCGAPLGIADRHCSVCAFPMGLSPAAPPPFGPSSPGAPLPVRPEPSRPQRQIAGFLVSFQDDPAGKVWILCRGRNTIGRAESGREVDIAVPSGRIGSFHAIIDCDESRFLLSDARSPSGTFLNEEAIGYGDKREVRDGDMIRFGGYDAMVISLAGRPWKGQ